MVHVHGTHGQRTPPTIIPCTQSKGHESANVFESVHIARFQFNFDGVDSDGVFHTMVCVRFVATTTTITPRIFAFFRHYPAAATTRRLTSEETVGERYRHSVCANWHLAPSLATIMVLPLANISQYGQHLCTMAHR